MLTLFLKAGAAALAVAAATWVQPRQGALIVAGFDIAPWILPAVMTFALAEGILLSLRPKGYDWKAWFASSADAVVREFVGLVPFSLVAPIFLLAWRHRLFTVPLGPWWSFALLLLGQEFCYYWLHRSSHHVRWFWATHAVHHSPNDYTLAAAYRLGWTSKLSGSAIFNAPLIWLGFRPEVVAATLLFNLLYQFWLHTELLPRLGWLEYVPEHPVASPRPPRRQRRLSRPQFRRRADRLRPAVRHFRRGKSRRAAALRAGPAPVLLQSRLYRDPRMARDGARRGARGQLARAARLCLRPAGLVASVRAGRRGGHALREPDFGQQRLGRVGYVFGPPGRSPDRRPARDLAIAPQLTPPARNARDKAPPAGEPAPCRSRPKPR